MAKGRRSEEEKLKDLGETKTETPSDKPKVKKVDMVRDALANGVEKPQEGVEFIQKKYGVEFSPTDFSVNKSNIRKKEAGTSSTAVVTAKSSRKISLPSGGDSLRGLLELVKEHGLADVEESWELIKGIK